MSDVSLDSEVSGSGRRGGTRAALRGSAWTWLVAGLLVGVVGTIFLPDLVAPYVPGLKDGSDTIEGEVMRKQREDERLLLTVDSDRGAVLATFRSQVAEIDLLVSEGDRVSLEAREFRPFLESPTLVGVRKGPSGAAGSGTGGAPEGAGGRGEAAGGPDTGDAPGGADTARSPGSP